MTTCNVSYNPLSDYYEVLDVVPEATQEQIVRAYRAAVKKHHPDVGGDPSCQRIKTVYEAYSVLGHPFKRAVYNSSRNRHGPPLRCPRMRPAVRLRVRRRWAAAAAMVFCAAAGMLLLAATAAGVKERAFGGTDRAERVSSCGPAAPDSAGPPGPAAVLYEYATPLDSVRGESVLQPGARASGSADDPI